MKLAQDFRKFALRGNVIDMAVGFTVGAAFSTIAKSLVTDILMPPIGLLLGQADFAQFYWLLKAGNKVAPPYATLVDAQAAGAVTMNYGVFINNLVAFLIVAIAMFAIIRVINHFNDELEDKFGEEKAPAQERSDKKCSFCLTTVPFRAVRCPACTSELKIPSAA